MVWSDTLKVNVYSINLIFDPTATLHLIWAIEFPVVILLFSCWALLNALGALALGAPVGLQYFEMTISWSLLMSSLTKTAWLAMFYICIPTGIALGYVYGGFVSWGLFSLALYIMGEALLMLPFAVLGFMVKPLQLKGFPPVESRKTLTSVETVSSVIDGILMNAMTWELMVSWAHEKCVKHGEGH
ncbi:hypothetical protein F3Y22_tig00112305pilonHSYRG00065 [Hibiscus syriacus]|uniref:Uncharacterized protein n=1 Tax=Hibiscus syriacus TaxID=106335 RepID=A0A6A2YBL3_HIBSY|nr:hypothetical protein F3Y22_tig00112305pilonHSYRG00065 [Hibiscus syriacus]